MTKLNIAFATSTAAIALSLLSAGAAQAANECLVGYGYKSGNTNMFKTVYLNAGQTKTISQSRLRYVQNRANAPVRIRVTRVNGIPPFASASGTKFVTLPNKNKRDPLIGDYFASPSTKLYSIFCQAKRPVARNSGQGTAITGILFQVFRESIRQQRRDAAQLNALKPVIANMPPPPHIFVKGFNAIAKFKEDQRVFTRVNSQAVRAMNKLARTIEKAIANSKVSGSEASEIRKGSAAVKRLLRKQHQTIVKLMGAKNQIVSTVVKMMKATHNAQTKVLANLAT